MDLTLQLCPSPDLIGCYVQQDWDSTLVVITDVFRASATILSALYHGAIEVRPVATIEESLQHQNDPDYLVAAERNARRVEGATLGNDPEEYTRDRVEGKRVVLTTTKAPELFISPKRLGRSILLWGLLATSLAFLSISFERNSKVYSWWQPDGRGSLPAKIVFLPEPYCTISGSEM